MTRAGLMVLAVALAALMQPVLVHFGHPEAVWLWCTMFNLCGASQ